MYHDNNCLFGFYVTRDSWASWRKAKVMSIEGVTEGKKIKGREPYYNNPKVTLNADWITPCGKMIIATGGNYTWTFFPSN